MKKITLLAASRERAERMFNVVHKWFNSASEPKNIEFIISIDSDDPTRRLYQKFIDNIDGINIKLIKSDNKNTVQAINACKIHVTGDIVFVISDDTDCFPGWNNSIIDFIGDKKNYIIKTSDGIGSNLITMPIFCKEYLDKKNYIYHPEYEHMFCDTELTCVANIEGCILNAEHLTFNHLHYTKGHHEKDRLDYKNQSTFYTGMEVFKKRLEKNFDIPNEKITGKIPEPILEYINNN